MLGPASGGIIVAVAGLGWLLVWPGEKTRNPFATYILTSGGGNLPLLWSMRQAMDVDE